MGWPNPRPLNISGSQRGLVEAVSDLLVCLSVAEARKPAEFTEAGNEMGVKAKR